MTDRIVAIQIGAASLQDEGVPKVLDIVTERAAVNTLFLATPTWNRATGGRPEAGRPFPDHGVQSPDKDWVGGNFATIHPEYYGNTTLGPVGRAVEHGDWDMLAEVLPEARRRGLRSFAFMDESSHARQLRSYPNFLKCLEVDIWNKPARRPCFNNPDYRNWVLSIVEDYIKSYDLDGLAFSSARPGPLDRLVQEPTQQGLGLVVCYCSHCKALGAKRGVDWRHAQEGYRKLVLWNASVAIGERPRDGAFATFWRLLLSYPELLAWQSLWTDGQHQLYRDIFGTVRAFRPDIKVGWDIYQNITLSPFSRAGQNFAELSHISDFIKVSTYSDAGGARLHTIVSGIARTIFGDAEPSEVYPVLSKMLGLQEGDLDELPRKGLSADYVRREVERAVIGCESRGSVYAGIDVNVPVGMLQDTGTLAPSPGNVAGIDADNTEEADLIQTTPERVKAAVLAAFEGGAAGIVLGRKYSEMRLDNLSGAGSALAQLAQAKRSAMT